MCLSRQAQANSLDSDQTPHSSASDQDLHLSCSLNMFTDSKMEFFKFYKYKVKSKVREYLLE